jgi:hypothetical protein
MENLIITYFWLAPVCWIVVTLSNRVLGKRIAAINQETLGYVSPEYKASLSILYWLRVFLFIPAIIYFWWFFTKFTALDFMYLVIAGYFLVLWSTAVIRQLSNLFLQALIQRLRLDAIFSKDELLKTMKLTHIGAAADYFCYFLIYLLVIILTQSWFVAGGAIACLVNVFRYIRYVGKTNPSENPADK